MEKRTNRKQIRRRIRHRIRKVVRGSAVKPRIAIYRSLHHIYAQAVDDGSGSTIAAAGSHETALGITYGGNVKAAALVGKLIATRLKDKGVSAAVFDRGGFKYHGRVKALADAAREAGLSL